METDETTLEEKQFPSFLFSLSLSLFLALPLFSFLPSFLPLVLVFFPYFPSIFFSPLVFGLSNI